MTKARKTVAKSGKAKRAKKPSQQTQKPKRSATKNHRPKRSLKIMDKLADASKFVGDGIEDAAKMRRQTRYPGIDEG
jgi:hypothetical protein